MTGDVWASQTKSSCLICYLSLVDNSMQKYKRNWLITSWDIANQRNLQSDWSRAFGSLIFKSEFFQMWDMHRKNCNTPDFLLLPAKDNDGILWKTLKYLKLFLQNQLLSLFSVSRSLLLTVCYYHVMYEFQSESTFYSLHECQGSPCSK